MNPRAMGQKWQVGRGASDATHVAGGNEQGSARLQRALSALSQSEQ